MKIIDRIPSVEELKAQMPLPENLAKERDRQRKEICRVLSGSSDKLLLIVGPCSADNKAATIEYVSRLAKLQEQIKDHAIIVPRVYTCKPRTTGDGYKGMLHQPVLTEEENIVKGLAAVRRTSPSRTCAGSRPRSPSAPTSRWRSTPPSSR